jgi:hypothetical protein
VQITRIECELGVTVNAGDFQSVKSTVKACADLDRNEDPSEAYAKLATFVHTSLVEGAKSSHPDQVRKMLTGDARLIEAATANAETKAKGKPGPKPKDKPATNGNAAPQEKLADTTGMDVGGLDKEGKLDDPLSELDDLDDLMGGEAAPEPCTKDEVQAALVKLNKKGGKTAVMECLKAFGVPNLSQLPETKYGEMKAKAETMAAAING